MTDPGEHQTGQFAPDLVPEVHRGHGQQGQHKQDSRNQLHAQAVALMMDVRAGIAARRAATLRYRPSTLGADQVLAAHPAPIGLSARPATSTMLDVPGQFPP
jgi:hypothetical protein